MPELPSFMRPSAHIAGVYVVTLKQHGDERGWFSETFRREWFPQVNWERVQTNRSTSRAGVLRGLHYHYRQVDYWYVVQGKIRAGMADLRPDSPTFRASETLELGEENHLGLFIPVGVAHGFYALTDCVLTYIVNNYYDASDEKGVAWDDPDLRVAWGVPGAPMLSGRDGALPRLRDIPADALPRQLDS